MHLLLLRHGETDWNVERRIQGWADSKLTELGQRQIELLSNRLRDLPLNSVYSSDARRARQTAEAIIGGREINLTVVAELRETGWGDWEGHTAAEISAAEPELWERFSRRSQTEPGTDQADWEATTLVPNGEPIAHASRRINGAVDRIVGHHSEDSGYIAVIGHGGSLRFVIANLLGLRPADARRFHLDNASVTHFEITASRKVLKLLNDSSHWSGTLVP
jgi:broad specificity phosphatase PhoE